MLHIGCHLSSAKGFLAMGRQALALDADTFQFFTRNPRGSRAKALDPADAAALMALLAENRFAPIIAHAPYILNLCGGEEENRLFSQELLADDLRRMEHLPGQLYNFHPGSHVGQGIKAGIAYIADGLNAVLTAEQTTTVLLETMSGKGSEVGSRFEELREILNQVDLGAKMGVCLDTCHASDAGYDLVNNDSLNPCGARKDRHARIGEGCIGLEALARIVNHPALKHLPFCLETPNDLAGYAREIALMRSQAK